jgi:hypothetical protein
MEPILLKYRRVFHDDVCNDFRGTDVIEHRIVTGDAKPVKRPQYKTPYALRPDLDRQVKAMLDKGVIEPSDSPWSSPVVLVPKRSTDDKPKYRFCVDFRALNALTRPDAYPLPVFTDTVSTLHGSRYFSVLDGYSGYWQVRLAEEDKPKRHSPQREGYFITPAYRLEFSMVRLVFSALWM